jgi:hypothetical protein
VKLTALLLIAAACTSNPSDPVTEIKGTWGGDDAGLIASDTSAHVHIGCTLGDTSTPIRPDARGNFDVSGTYNVDAYPIDRGILHPARFTGTVSGNELTITVTLVDTGAQLGPVRLVRGKEPKMGPCPICRKPGERSSRGALQSLIINFR